MKEGFSLIVEDKLYFLEVFYSENLININVLKNNKFVKIKEIHRKLDPIRSVFAYKNKIGYTSLDYGFTKHHEYGKYRIFSIDLKSFDITLEYYFITKHFHICNKNYFIWIKNNSYVLGILNFKNKKWKYIKLPFREMIYELDILDDYIVINNSDIYCMDKKTFLIEKFNTNIKNLLFSVSTYKNYIVYRNITNSEIYIYNVKIKQIHNICNIKSQYILFYDNKLLHFNYHYYFNDIDIKIHNLPISNLFEKCVYWVDAEKFPEIAKKRIEDYRKDYMIIV